jgi:predicted aminopeptidase
VNPIDKMLMRWSDKHPDKAWFPSPIINAEFKHGVTGESVKMNPAQLAEFRTLAGKRAQALLRIRSVNMDNPTEKDVDLVKAAITKARSDTKKALRFKFSRQQPS